LIALFGRIIEQDRPGAGRLSYDGRLQVIGFYLLAWDQHLKNLKNLLADLKKGDNKAAERQKTFYQWYNFVHHYGTFQIASSSGRILRLGRKFFVESQRSCQPVVLLTTRGAGIED
jgi:hypothetical protein